jgi:hypothetical protein
VFSIGSRGKVPGKTCENRRRNNKIIIIIIIIITLILNVWENEEH